MLNALRPLFDLFYPPSCRACAEALSTGEHMLCTSCRHSLPVTQLHLTTAKPIHELLYARVDLQLAAALFHFDKKSKVQQLIHNLKYRGHEDISGFLGNWLGSELEQVASFSDIDCVLPVPLHRLRRRKRGYNQVEGFGRAIAEKLNRAYVDDVLFRTTNTRTQVFLTRFFRASDIINSFDVRERDSLKGKHILLVDDLITTGGTIEGCALALQKIQGIRVSVAVMAIAR